MLLMIGMSLAILLMLIVGLCDPRAKMGAPVVWALAILSPFLALFPLWR